MNIELSNISKSFLDKQVLNDISFELLHGKKYHLQGENGAGKTTLLRILAKDLTQDSGTLFFDENAYLSEKDFSYLDTFNQGLFERMSGEENIKIISSLLKIEKTDLDKKLSQWLVLPSFKNAYETSYALCSAGMKRILKVFIMTLHDPKLLIWDEPFFCLDQQSIKFLHEKFWNDQFTIIYTSHETKDYFSDDLKIRLEKGKIVN